MTLERLTNLLVAVTLFEMMVAIGLSVTFADLMAVVRNWRLVAGAILANYVCVPAVTVGLLLLFDPHPMVVVGFLILAVCPGAPFGPPVAALAKGNVTAAVGLMVILAGSSALVAPLLLRPLMLLTSKGEAAKVDPLQIAGTLLMTQLIPLCLGVVVRQWLPRLADRIQKPATLLSKVLNLAVIGLILATQYHLLAEIRPRGYFGMLLLLLASWAAGWLLGGREEGTRKAMTLTTSLRNVGVGLVIATASFPGTPAVTATLVYGLFGVFGSLLLAVVWGGREERKQ